MTNAPRSPFDVFKMHPARALAELKMHNSDLDETRAIRDLGFATWGATHLGRAFRAWDQEIWKKAQQVVQLTHELHTAVDELMDGESTRLSLHWLDFEGVPVRQTVSVTRPHPVQLEAVLRLERGIEQNKPKRRGRGRPDIGFRAFIGRLAAVYLRHTAKKAAAGNSRKGDKDSPFIRFVCAVIQDYKLPIPLAGIGNRVSAALQA
jgi:hypothetical protein